MVQSFASLQLKKFELEFSVDPLFKKASADFDEGGAKGLLLNHLSIDSMGRIVFDSSDDAEDTVRPADSTKIETDTTERTIGRVPAISTDARPTEIDLGSLGARFLPDLARLDEQDICPSLKNFVLGDPSGSLDMPFLKPSEELRHDTNCPVKGNLGDQTGIFLDGDNVAGFEDDDGILGGFDLGANAGFGEGGEAWAKEAAVEPQIHMQGIGFAEENFAEGQDENGAGIGDFDPHGGGYAVSLHHNRDQAGHEDILSYFDNALQKNWAGPEHWRIRRIKDSNKASAPAPSKRKEKEPFEIDFASPLDPASAETIYTPATSNSIISLPKIQWKSKTRNLLPDDKHFNSRQLLRLFLKPKARIGSRVQEFSGHRRRKLQSEVPENDVDEVFWAQRGNIATQSTPIQEELQGDYDANFFQDDGLGFQSGPPEDDEDFADAREAFSSEVHNEVEGGNPGIDIASAGKEGSQEGAFGMQLVTQSRRLRPEYVQYARVAKKVDVRRLKEEMWKGIDFDDVRIHAENGWMSY